jgi:hypothetical protein
MTKLSDLEGPGPPCAWAIGNATGFGAKKINFVVTVAAMGDYDALDRWAASAGGFFGFWRGGGLAARGAPV